jgi:predicted glycosyltransferase
MPTQQGGTRLLIYSHDSFGLGHLRRCRTIANSLVAHRPELSVLILSGSPIIGSFDFRTRVDFVRIPGVIKLRDGDYTSLSLDMSIEELMDVRAAIIKGTAEAFEPDIFLVDKEPLGLRGEVRETLEMLNAANVPCVLGLRDVMDDPDLLTEEWERKNALPALRDLYDEIWVYGLEDIHDPLRGLDVPDAVRRKMTFTGYLRRSWAHKRSDTLEIDTFDLSDPYLLVTTGGGGDGAALIDWVLRAYESDETLPLPALMVLGPFMSTNYQAEFMSRAERLDRVHVITFDTQIEALFANAAAVVGMGGYNTFCEVLSFDKPSLIVPRRVPRLEQFIRAERAETLGLAAMLVDEGVRRTEDMTRALHALATQAPPSHRISPGVLDGLSTINGLADQLLDRASDRAEPPSGAEIAPLRSVP